MNGLRIKRLSPTATLPTRGSAFAIGADLYADLAWRDAGPTLVIPVGERVLVPTNIAARPPEGHYIRLAPRSGLALNKGIQVMGGVIDLDYAGHIQAILYNSSYEPFTIRHGDRIAQMICERATIAPIVEVDELEETERGAGGFGSSGR